MEWSVIYEMEGVWRDVAWCTERNISGIYFQLVRNSKENRTSWGILRFEAEKPNFSNIKKLIDQTQGRIAQSV